MIIRIAIRIQKVSFGWSILQRCVAQLLHVLCHEWVLKVSIHFATQKEMSLIEYSRLRIPALALLTTAVIAACGGGDGSSSSIAGFASVPATAVAVAPPIDVDAISLAVAPPTDVAATPAPPAPITEQEEAEQFAKIAPPDKVLNDENRYDVTSNANIELPAVNEESSVKQHTITLNGRVIPYVARAGHLIARRWQAVDELPAHNPEAAIFYTSYTRDALPKEDRPITFMWNGGPGSPSIWLHLGSWGPKRPKSDAPKMASETVQPNSFPFKDNTVSLLDQSDIVFVDPPGTGLSTAIAPFKNHDFWGTDSDAQVVADFITSYVNKYGRQSSPKYLYGESYGGIRTPIVANLLTQAGTSEFEPDGSGKPAKVLTGFVLNSPLVDYASNCDVSAFASCAGYIPSYAMVADYFKKSVMRGAKSQTDYLEELRGVAREYQKTVDAQYIIYSGFYRRDPDMGDLKFWSLKAQPSWMNFSESKKGLDQLAQLDAYTGIDMAAWKKNLIIHPHYFRTNLMPVYELGRYDARMKVPKGNKFAADEYIHPAFIHQMESYLPDFVNYMGVTPYEFNPPQPMKEWVWNRTGERPAMPQSITDIQAVLTANPSAKLLILHGYEDVATPGFQTELDLERVNLKDRVPVKWFEGGHMIYNTEASRVPLKQTLDAYYSASVSGASSPVAIQ